jgi:hypothetical protein
MPEPTRKNDLRESDEPKVVVLYILRALLPILEYDRMLMELPAFRKSITERDLLKRAC